MKFEEQFPSLIGYLEEVPNYLEVGVSGFLLWPGHVQKYCLDVQRVKAAIEKEMVCGYIGAGYHDPNICRKCKLLKVLGLE